MFPLKRRFKKDRETLANALDKAVKLPHPYHVPLNKALKRIGTLKPSIKKAFKLHHPYNVPLKAILFNK